MIDSKELEKIINDLGVNFYGSEIVNENDQKIVRIFITSKDGISLDKCAEVSSIISPILDLNPPTSGKYFLEVSSPGIERKLNTLRELELSVGELIKATIVEDGERVKIKGELLNVDGDLIEVDDKISKEIKRFEYSSLLKAKTYYIWN